MFRYKIFLGATFITLLIPNKSKLAKNVKNEIQTSIIFYLLP